MRIGRRAALAAAFLPLGRPAGAQADYPSRPVRLVVGYPAGGSTDVVARLLAERLGRSLGQPVIVENRPGASGTLGADAVAKAAPDGHTLLVGASGEMAIARATLRSIPYAPEDFAPIALLTEQPFLVLVNGALPADSLAALVALARARPGTLNYGSFGTGTAPHLLGELLKAEAGIEVTHVPYRGSAPLTADLLAGQVQFSFDTIPAALPHLGTGKLRALALCRATRAAAVPGVPTTAEAGMPWLLGGTWASLVAPARVPEAIQARLGAAVRQAMGEALADALRERGLEPVGADAAAARRYIAAEQTRWAAIARRGNVQPE
ncbi:tripartite tricarboxylate transporter substrate-binding protein [Paeniroseomonas aquatica]|uniref:Tripartite tricarboxylate transporter substrate-binding protein n=1 Tax=Paeniroseomonas aquatica TaxID=373043 RepID=A0ABT8A6N2_9PROT|nr:tripartite tricarboxylate transporter substrate-binding protein [Paeniroseomonas aquatica]MDN3565310.1 tripartite tricarboxylate transporter substrate-binding protein [Paeniroseomonas aquatica]